MDSDYPFDFTSEHDHPDLNSLTAADIEAIGSGFASPLPAHIALPDPGAPGPGDGDTQLESDDLGLHVHAHEHGEGERFDAVAEDFLHRHGNGHGDQDLDHDHEHDYVPDPDAGEGEGEGEGEASGSQKRMSRREFVGMSTHEKKQRTRDSNRRAAERSRAKKRKEQGSIEVQITQLRKENERLRARLTALNPNHPPILPAVADPTGDIEADWGAPAPTLGSASPQARLPASASGSNTKAVGVGGVGVDHAYVAKLDTELFNAQALLLDKQTELAALGGREAMDHITALRKDVLKRHSGMTLLRAEEAAMSTVLALLNDETAELAGRRKAIQQELVQRGLQLPPRGSSTAAKDELLVEAEGLGMEAGDASTHSQPLELGGDEAHGDETTEEQANRTRVLAQAVRDAAMGEAATGGQAGSEDGMDKDDYDIQPFIEQAVQHWHEHQDTEVLNESA